MKKRYIILLIVSLVCVAICLGLNAWYRSMLQDDGLSLESKRDEIKEFIQDTPETKPAQPSDTDTSDTPDTSDSADTAGESTDETDTAPAESGENPPPAETLPDFTETSNLLLNFEKLWQTNREIIAWLEIKDTYIDYPVLQSKDNDKKYLNRAYDGSWYLGGALFTEATYNRTDFNDPVTVIYGHTMPWNILFGSLQRTYSDSASFKRNQQITLYLPGEAREYTVFAAVPYSKTHILHANDFTNEYQYKSFFRDIKMIREIGGNTDPEKFPEWGDRVLILSVCLNEDTARRYLVMAVLNEDLADNVSTASK